MPDQFNAPASGKFEAKEHNGKLLIIKPTEYITGIATTFGEKDAIDAEIVVVDETDPAESLKIDNGRIFSGPLIGATKPFVGKGLVLGRLHQGEAKKGQQPPWLLSDPTDADRKAAQAYLNTTAPQL